MKKRTWEDGGKVKRLALQETLPLLLSLSLPCCDLMDNVFKCFRYRNRQAASQFQHAIIPFHTLDVLC